MSLYELQERLLDQWSTRKVNENYQAVFLAYLDSFHDEEEAISAISEEIKKLINRNSNYDFLQKSIKTREAALNALKSKIEEVDHSSGIKGGSNEAGKILDDDLRAISDKIS